MFSNSSMFFVPTLILSPDIYDKYELYLDIV